MATKKVKRAGRYGARYGKGIKNKIMKVEAEQFAVHNCPSCETGVVKREAVGIYECKSCGYKFTGGAYFPKTMTGEIIRKVIEQRGLTKETAVEALSKIQAGSENIEEPEEKKAETKEHKKERKEKKEKNVPSGTAGGQTATGQTEEKQTGEKAESNFEKLKKRLGGEMNV